MEVTAYSSPHRTEDTGNLEAGSSYIFFRFEKTLLKETFPLIFRHFLHLPSLTEEERRTVRVLCWSEGGVEFQLLVPTALEDQIVVVQSEVPAWFMVN